MLLLILTGRKSSTYSTKFVFCGPIGKTRWPLWPLIGWDIFDFSSETAERNSTKLARSKISTSSTKFVCFGLIRKTRWPPSPLIGWYIFNFSSETAERNSTKLDRKQDLNVLYQVCVFRAYRKNKMATLASDWLRHCRLLLWNRWTEFNETWQEPRCQCPLPSLYFSGRSVNKNRRPGRFLKKVVHCTHVHDMWPFGPLVYAAPCRYMPYMYFKVSYWISMVIIIMSPAWEVRQGYTCTYSFGSSVRQYFLLSVR